MSYLITPVIVPRLCVEQVKFVPYMSMSERQEVLRYHKLQCELGDIVHKRLEANIALVRSHGKRQVTAATMDSLKRKHAVSTVSFFWNYNTVESTLLFCAVLVNLAGTFRFVMVCRAMVGGALWSSCTFS